MNQEQLMNIFSVDKAIIIWESIFFIFFFINSIYCLYFFVPYSMILKLAITLISVIVVVNIFKNYLYVKWILLNENNETIENEEED
jgi:hypothetical protein